MGPSQDWVSVAVSVRGAKEIIHDAVLKWPQITALPHRLGGTEYRLGHREIGHVHGDYLVDIPFPKKVRDALVTAGRAQPHHILPQSGWVSFYIKDAADVEQAVELLRLSFDLANQKRIINKVRTNNGVRSIK